jgi:hypothetical protein
MDWMVIGVRLFQWDRVCWIRGSRERMVPRMSIRSHIVFMSRFSRFMLIPFERVYVFDGSVGREMCCEALIGIEVSFLNWVFLDLMGAFVGLGLLL